MPFVIVQLPNHLPRLPDPADSAWAMVLRESQAQAVSETPRTALVVTIELGEAGNIHPADKQDVGSRAVLAALSTIYGKPEPASGPVCTTAAIVGSAIKLQFHITGKSLKTTDGTLKGFAIAGKDHKSVQARGQSMAEQS